LHELGLGEHARAALDEQSQKIERLGPEIHAFAIPPQEAGLGVEVELGKRRVLGIRNPSQKGGTPWGLREGSARA
jgi:hypothetical protein